MMHFYSVVSLGIELFRIPEFGVLSEVSKSIYVQIFVTIIILSETVWYFQEPKFYEETSFDLQYYFTIDFPIVFCLIPEYFV